MNEYRNLVICNNCLWASTNKVTEIEIPQNQNIQEITKEVEEEVKIITEADDKVF